MNSKIAKKIRKICEIRKINYKHAKRYFELHPELKPQMLAEYNLLRKKLLVIDP